MQIERVTSAPCTARSDLRAGNVIWLAQAKARRARRAAAAQPSMPTTTAKPVEGDDHEPELIPAWAQNLVLGLVAVVAIGLIIASNKGLL